MAKDLTARLLVTEEEPSENGEKRERVGYVVAEPIFLSLAQPRLVTYERRDYEELSQRTLV
jgi:hypothetical protein